jgi:hypothetical protein
MVAALRKTTPAAARAQLLIGDKQECLDTWSAT